MLVVSGIQTEHSGDGLSLLHDAWGLSRKDSNSLSSILAPFQPVLRSVARMIAPKHRFALVHHPPSPPSPTSSNQNLWHYSGQAITNFSSLISCHVYQCSSDLALGVTFFQLPVLFMLLLATGPLHMCVLLYGMFFPTLFAWLTST